MFDIYAIFYETTDDVKMLDGTNKFSHPNLISVARIEDAKRRMNGHSSICRLICDQVKLSTGIS